MTPLWFVLLWIGIGLLAVAWLLNGLLRVPKRPRFDQHDWRVDQVREERLRAAAMWKGYRRQ